jgi:hypothetical protein
VKLHRHRRAFVALATAGSLALSGCAFDAAAEPARHDHGRSSAGNARAERIDPDAFAADMRKLWEDHVTWTRLYLVSAIADLPDVDATAQRLLQNQDDIGGAMAAFYGRKAGDQLAALLRDHILIAADLVTAAKAGDAAAVTEHHVRWYANADDISKFLASANRRWDESTLRAMMREHLDQTLAEATARLTGDWAADIAEYDAIHLHILEMADVLSDGVVRQFPKRFHDHSDRRAQTGHGHAN